MLPGSKTPARRWSLLALLMLAAWYAALLQAFAARAELSIQLLALLGTLAWTFPAGLALGNLLHRRRHIAWIFPLALPGTASLLYLAFTSAEILPTGDRLDLHPAHIPGRFHIPIAATVCPFAAAGIAFGFLASPRPFAQPKRFRCINCNYDIRQSLPAGRCPECGHAFIPGVDFPAHLPPNSLPANSLPPNAPTVPEPQAPPPAPSPTPASPLPPTPTSTIP